MQAVRRHAVLAVIVACAYYVGANVGFMLRLPPTTPSLSWPPNTILTAVLLLTPPRYWAFYLLAALPAHLVAEMGLGWSLSFVLTLFVTNCSQALIAAVGVRLFSDAPARFDTLRRVTVFILAAGLAAPFLSSFLDATAVTVFLGEPYWAVWSRRFFSNVLTEIVLGPAIVIAVSAGPAWLRHASRARKAEAVAIAISLALATGWVFGMLSGAPVLIEGEAVVVIVLPMIFLATARFGTGGAALALLTTSLIAIWSSAHARGPFAGLPVSGGELVRELQILLIALAIPILCLAAVIAERRAAERALAEQLRLETVLARLSAALVHPSSEQIDLTMESAMRQIAETVAVDRAGLWREMSPEGAVERYVWNAPSSDPDLKGLAEGQFPWTTAQIRREEVVVFSRLEELPAAAAHDLPSFRRYGVRSALIVPVVVDTRVLAALSLVTASSERTWPKGIVQWLQLVAETFASALARKEAENALRASEQSKSAILASLTSAVAVLDGDGRIVDVNARWRRAEPPPVMCGVGDNLLDGFARSPSVDAVAAVPGILGVLRGERSEFALEYRCQATAGDPWYLVTAVPLEGVDGGAVVSCTDITERKRADLDAERRRHELAHFTRVSTLAQLAVSLAHEMNQPLTGILVNARAGLRLLDGAPPDVNEVKDILRDVIDDDKRAAEVIQRLRDLLRKGDPERVLLDLNVVVQDVAQLLVADAIIRNVTVTLELSPRAVLVTGDRVELQQVVLDLVLNAIDAVTEAAGRDRTVVVATGYTSSGTVQVVVRDSGPGLRPGSRDFIFQPLFTTKPKRLGMGLAIARSIVEDHGGVISAADNPAGGAVLHVALPAAVLATSG